MDTAEPLFCPPWNPSSTPLAPLGWDEQQPDSGQEGRVLRSWAAAGKVFPDHPTPHESAPDTPIHLSDLWMPFYDLLVKSTWRDITNVQHLKPNCPETHPKGNRAAQAPIPYCPYPDSWGLQKWIFCAVNVISTSCAKSSLFIRDQFC